MKWICKQIYFLQRVFWNWRTNWFSFWFFGSISQIIAKRTSVYVTIVNINVLWEAIWSWMTITCICQLVGFPRLFGWLLLVNCDSWRSRRLSPITLNRLHSAYKGLLGKGYCCLLNVHTVPTVQLRACVRLDMRGDRGTARARRASSNLDLMFDCIFEFLFSFAFESGHKRTTSSNLGLIRWIGKNFNLGAPDIIWPI